MATIIPLLIQLVSGAAGGNLAGTLLKNLPVGKILRTVLGGVGGGLGGLLMSVLAGGAEAVAVADVAGAVGGGGLDIGSILQGVGGGGAGGGILVTIVGMIKKMMGGQNVG